MDKEEKKKMPWSKRILFFLLTSADEAQWKYDGKATIPDDLILQWSIEIEEVKKNLYITRMRNRTSISYWLQWLFPLVCMFILGLETLYAFYEGLDLIADVNWVTWITSGFGGSTGVNIVRKVSRHAYLKRQNGSTGAEQPTGPRNAPGNKPVEPEEIDAAEDESDGGIELSPEETQK